MSIGGSSKIAASLALIDPTLTIKLPPSITRATGMDALVHAVEAYTKSNPVALTRDDYLKLFEKIYASDISQPDMLPTPLSARSDLSTWIEL